MANVSIKRVAITGVVGGLLAGAVKMGWEALLPPRTPERDEEPPPVTMMKVFNVPDSVRNASYVYNDNEVPLAVMGIHYGFSVVNATLYALLSEQSESVSTWKGGLFGIGVHVIFHEFVLPKLKLTPARDELPPEEHFSELLGHIVWMYTIDLVRTSVK
ncbi:DUF1440 domain-containing protein [Staphylococcus sp. GSSP0090]|nr:DUF1440 domain-containing protein [Staphylococcus sp. GSSP0090]